MKTYSFTAEELSTVLKSVVITYVTIKKEEYNLELCSSAPYQAVLDLLQDDFIESMNETHSKQKLDDYLEKVTTIFATAKN